MLFIEYENTTTNEHCFKNTVEKNQLLSKHIVNTTVFQTHLAAKQRNMCNQIFAYVGDLVQ